MIIKILPISFCIKAFLFLINSCMSSKKVDTSSFNENNLYDLSIEEYKEMLKNYNNNKDFPDIEN